MSIRNLHTTKLQFKFNQGEKNSNTENQPPKVENVQQVSNEKKTRKELITARQLRGVAKTFAVGLLALGTYGGANSIETAIGKFDSYNSPGNGQLEREADDLTTKKAILEGASILTGGGILKLAKKQEKDEDEEDN